MTNPGLYVTFETSKGKIVAELYYDKTPLTVANFAGLAKGELENKVKQLGEPYYDGLTFHRVIADFMIQGGDPQGTGVGGPGYQFHDEFHPELKHDGPGKLSMANAGPGTNGSQFFITHGATDWLDNKHTIFGQVIEGQDVVDSIAQGDTMDKLVITAVGSDAENFEAAKVFNEAMESKKKAEEDKRKAEAEALKDLVAGMKQTDSGLFYKTLVEGTGKVPTKGQLVSVHYTGKLKNGTTFDSSYQRGQPIRFPVGVGQVIPGWDEGIMLLKEGERAKFVIPSELGYGSRGAGGVIPPNATLIFEVELVQIH
ncbi:MAG: peptidylprolyl isomerase [Flavobacteriia bacterium]|nr:peptidylprolyl isomerase [Flavobacteriia bacterium]